MLSFCDEYGMIVNQGKTKFMVVNGDDFDKGEIMIGEDIRVEYSDTYWYLGSPVCDDGNMTTLIYGTETWLTDNFKQLNILYGRIIRALLGVKHSTPIDLSY